MTLHNEIDSQQRRITWKPVEVVGASLRLIRRAPLNPDINFDDHRRET